MLTKPIRVHTIIFTKACPLHCRYCYFEHGSSGTWEECAEPTITKEEFFQQLDNIDKTDDMNLVTSQILFSGGEPFLYWSWIKEAIEKYRYRFNYQFNTSGYCFTPEILKFLSNYNVNFVLSVDGGEKLTNYLRPVRETTYHTGYYKKLKEVLPYLLYYFPSTPFRMIVNSRYVDLMYEQYLEAERLGFKYFTFILDFDQRPVKPIGKPWTEEDSKKLKEQLNLILQEILIGFEEGVKKPELCEVNKILQFLFNKKLFSTNNYECQVFAGRDGFSILGRNNGSASCFGAANLKEIQQNIENAYIACNHQCLKDKDCPAFEFCAQYTCPQSAYTNYGEFFHIEDLECIQNKIDYEIAIKMLLYLQDNNTILGRKYLEKFLEEGSRII